MMYGWHFAALGRAGCTLPPRPCFEPGELAAPVARFSVVPAGRGGGDSATGAGSGGLATEATGAAVTTTGCGSGGGGERSMREAAGASLIADANALRQLPRFVAAKERAATATAAAPAMTNRVLQRCDLACPERGSA